MDCRRFYPKRAATRSIVARESAPRQSSVGCVWLGRYNLSMERSGPEASSSKDNKPSRRRQKGKSSLDR
ncbi:hypothetical protein JTE90_024412 [Oedothorax gibbosus]|uniref:Uncharacterized protein n=1 Tax=Oedothorax gibbosus TaxID=931172 RepID=A0AAV6TE90_9ARAC|nr:hypothetical protein JTE90_024412 [Oedothorax gibbosus]